MRIGIDARMYGLEHAGIGRYVKNLVSELAEMDKHNLYRVVLKQRYANELDLPDNFEKVVSDVGHYTLAEQVSFYRLIRDLDVDIFHFPHFNVPYMYNKPFVCTIHDLLWHQQTGAEVTTLSPWKYRIKYRGYKQIVKHAVDRSGQIVVPSAWVEQKLLEHFPQTAQDKIRVVYEGADSDLIKAKPRLSGMNIEFDTYVVYVGSAYPHKNLRTLVRSLEFMKGVGVVIVSSRDVFLHQLNEYIVERGMQDMVQLAGFATDEQLVAVMQGGLALIQPSLSEGFGLTGLEAMSVGVPVIAAKAGAMPEVYGKAAEYFEAEDEKELADAVMYLKKNKKKRQEMVKKGKKQAENYSWKKMAQEMLEVYEGG